ncbi:hypothetical protein KKH39_00065 [Patescibacteria group bacterium]|nr:hypothetical protein [Patescibacteria group bacterium]
MPKNYQKDIEFIEGLSNIPRQNYLLGIHDRAHFISRLENFLSLVGSPHKGQNFIHVTGTSGKGTTVKVLESLIANARLKVGSFTSPFATTSIEKISINNKLISPQELHQILENDIKPALDKYVLKFKTEAISYFEVWLAIALLHFKNKKCNWVILEAGLGGRHDATNVIANPKVTAITNVGMDHMEILGNSKSAIAKDKAGIIKKNSIFITTEKNPKLLKIFLSVCKNKQAWYIQPSPLSKNYQLSNYFDTKRQRKNLDLALNILDVLKIKPKNIQSVINSFGLICRQEIISQNPLIILDGSHNGDKLSNLIEFVKKQKYKKMYLILGFGFTKHYKVPLKKLIPLANKIYITRYLISGKKTADLKKLKIASQKISPKTPINIYHDPYQALESALKSAKQSDLILVTGSFFLAGEIRKKWVSEEYIIKELKLDKR